MRPLSRVQASPNDRVAYDAAVRIVAIILAVLLFVPDWSGEERVARFPPGVAVAAMRVPLDAADPGRSRVGALRFLGGVRLTSGTPGFGGFSALAVRGARITLLSDSSNILDFRLARDWRLHHVESGALPAGPRTGWEKRDRDSESLAVDPRSGRIWVGFESANAIWRYSRDFARAEAWARPAAMRWWPANGGAEAMALMPDGRFVVISEDAHVAPKRWRGSDAARLATRDGLIFAGDPTKTGPPGHFAYRIAPHYAVADATALANGDLLVLERAFHLPYRFSNRVMLVPAAALRDRGIAEPRLLATLDAPLIHDNFEGIATGREAGRTVIWLVSDDNQSMLQRTLLLKFALGG